MSLLAAPVFNFVIFCILQQLLICKPECMCITHKSCPPDHCSMALIVMSVSIKFFYVVPVVAGICEHLGVDRLPWYCSQEVASLMPGLARLRNNSRQAIRTHVPLSPGSIIWYWCKQGRKEAHRMMNYLCSHSANWCLTESCRNRDQCHLLCRCGSAKTTFLRTSLVSLPSVI